MPYVPGGTSQGDSGLVEVQDVYHSPSVFANGVPVALWNAPGVSAAFSGLSMDLLTNPVILPDQTQKELAGGAAAYLAAQQSAPGQPNQYYNTTAASDGVKGNYAGTPDDGRAQDPNAVGLINPNPTASDIIPFLQQCLSEATRGLWRETGQGGKASNPNITGIWTNLGYPGSSPWNTDQTAWCMGFVNFTLKAAGYKYFQTASAAAITQSPQKWNATQVPKDQAQPGDIAFWSYRHVNFVYAVNNGKYTFVGGNQTPKGGSNNPDDGDVTVSWPTGMPYSHPSLVSIWRPSKS
jgi:hypothetical protein